MLHPVSWHLINPGAFSLALLIIWITCSDDVPYNLEIQCWAYPFNIFSYIPALLSILLHKTRQSVLWFCLQPFSRLVNWYVVRVSIEWILCFFFQVVSVFSWKRYECISGIVTIFANMYGSLGRALTVIHIVLSVCFCPSRVKMARLPCTWQPSMEGFLDLKLS